MTDLIRGHKNQILTIWKSIDFCSLPIGVISVEGGLLEGNAYRIRRELSV